MDRPMKSGPANSLRTVQLSYKRVSDWAKRLKLNELQRDSLNELLREHEVQTVAPKYPMQHGPQITQFYDEVFVWYDEAGHMGGAVPTLDEAHSCLNHHVDMLENGTRESIHPPIPAKLVHRRHGLNPEETELLPRALVFDESVGQWAIAGTDLSTRKPVTIALEALCGTRAPYHGMSNRQAELMYVMLDEMSGLLKATSRQLRHGPRSSNPVKDDGVENRQQLSIEFGRLWAAYTSLGDDNGAAVQSFRQRLKDGPGYLHHEVKD